jgi:hypothetical protein
VFGCGDPLAPGELAFASVAAEGAYGPRADRLRHAGGIERDVLDWLRETRRRAGAWTLGSAGVFGLLREALMFSAGTGGAGSSDPESGGRSHTVDSTPETV